MKNRLKDCHVTIPDGYNRRTFEPDLIELIGRTDLRVEDCQIKFSMVEYHFQIEKEGQKFNVDIFSLLGAVWIEVIQVRED